MLSVADINLNQVIRSHKSQTAHINSHVTTRICFYCVLLKETQCLVKAADLSGVKLWNCWVTQSLGVWLRRLWPGVIAGKKALSPPINPRNYCLCKRNIAVIEHFHSLPKCTVSITCTRHNIFAAARTVSRNSCRRLPSSLFKLSSHRHRHKQILYVYREFVQNINCTLTGKCMSVIHYLFFCYVLFQGRMGRKGFPGKVGPEGVKVNKYKYSHVIFFSL